jgi:hypothetical protein
MFRLYGDELSPDELAEYDIPGKIAEVHAEADAIIASEPIFAEYGISNFADYLEYENGHSYVIVGDPVVTTPNGKTVSEDDLVFMDTLLYGGIDGETLLDIDEWHESPAGRVECLENLMSRYREYYNDFLNPNIYIQNDLRPVVVRTAEKLVQTRNASLIRYDLCLTFSAYAAVIGIFSLFAVIILVAPFVANDRRRRLHLLQYSSAVGRKIFKTQFAVTAVSAIVLSLVIIIVGYIPLFNAAWEYRNAHIMALDIYGMWLYDITFGQYALILAAMSLALSVGAACFTFALARFSANNVTLMIKAVPVAAAAAAICAVAVYNALSYDNIIFNQVFLGQTNAPETILCIAVMITGLITAVVVMAREKRADVA